MAIAIGAFLNAIGILLGALFGLALRKPLSLRTQVFFRSALGAFTIFFGLRLVYENVGGTFSSCLKQIFLALLAVVLGFWLGKFLGLQKISNRLGRIAGNSIAAAQKNPRQKFAVGFNACAILFCAAPLGIVGAITDGLSDYFYFLAVKALMDALAMISFVKIFRWPCGLSAIPVFIFLSVISLACQIYVKPFLELHGLTNSVNAAAGFLACIVTVVIFEVRKVELANYLPALAIAPIFSWLMK
jgi:hypothetical protein